MTSTSVRPSNYNNNQPPSKDPNTAAIMSLLFPGLGQLYNGETRKGALFMFVAVLNLILILAMAFNLPILEGMLAFGAQYHMKPNKMLLVVLREAFLGSPVSFILFGFFLSFIFYAVRDAYDHAAMKRRRIYPDFVIELPEATSGSYIFHFSIMVALFIVAFFFVIPPMPKSQLTEIEFVDQQMKVREKVKAPRHAKDNAKAAGKHEPKKEVKVPKPASQQKQEAPKAPSQSHAPAQPKQASQSQAKPAPPTPHAAPPTPHAAPPTPHAAPPTPHAAPPTPSPAAPTPTPTPRPMPMAHAPSPTAAPAAPAMPHMPAAAAPSAMPKMAPAPMAMPSATPMPMAGAPKSFAPAAMPSLSPSALPKAGSGSGMPTPMARPNGGGGVAGLPTLAPSAISMGSGGGSGGGTSNFAPLAKSGSSGGGSGFGAPSAPGPVAAGGGGGRSGGGASGGPVPVAMAGGGGGGGSHGGPSGGSSGGPAPVRAGRGGGGGGGGWSSGPISIMPSVPKGGGGGEGAAGNPDANNNPGGKPSVAAQADVDFGPYMADLQRRIKRAWFPPRGQESRRVSVIFKIHSQGELSDLRIEKSSGVATADQAALQAVQNAAPFRPLPAGAPAAVDIQFTFDYNVFSGGRSF